MLPHKQSLTGIRFPIASLETVWASSIRPSTRETPASITFPAADGNGALATAVLGNSECRLAASGSTAVATGNHLSRTLRTTFEPEFYGAKELWVAARTLDSAPASPRQVPLIQSPPTTEGRNFAAGRPSTTSGRAIAKRHHRLARVPHRAGG